MATHRISDRKEFVMSNDDKSLAHTRWNCKYHIVFTPKSIRDLLMMFLILGNTEVSQIVSATEMDSSGSILVEPARDNLDKNSMKLAIGENMFFEATADEEIEKNLEDTTTESIFESDMDSSYIDSSSGQDTPVPENETTESTVTFFY